MNRGATKLLCNFLLFLCIGTFVPTVYPVSPRVERPSQRIVRPLENNPSSVKGGTNGYGWSDSFIPPVTNHQ